MADLGGVHDRKGQLVGGAWSGGPGARTAADSWCYKLDLDICLFAARDAGLAGVACLE